MKKTLLFLAAAASFGTASAQKMGDLFVYGSIGYTDVKQHAEVSGTNTDISHERSFTFNPGVGYQFNTNWGAGLMAEFMSSKSGTTTTTNDNQTFVGPFVRYTRNLSNLFFLFGQLDAGYIRTNRPFSSGTTSVELEGNGFGVRIMPAVGVNVSRSIALIGSFGNISYSRLTENTSGGGGDLVTQGIGATFGSNFTLGVQWNFGSGRRMGSMQPMDETRRMDTSDDNSSDDMPRRRRRNRDSND